MEPLLLNKSENMPRTDYPRPMWMRNEWYSLNGEWDFEFDFGNSGEERFMFDNGEFSKKIIVPFCPESKLSGIGYLDFMPAVWYRKTFTVKDLGTRRAILHFGAVDYESKVWVNGKACGVHKGGYCAFEYDITEHLVDGENTVVVGAKDDNRSWKQPRGKQCLAYKSRVCSYTRTTGIWQTVWLELVPEVYLATSKMTPHAADGALEISVRASSFKMDNYSLKLSAYYGEKKVGEATARFVGDRANAYLTVDEVHLWEVLAPEIYDLKLELIKDGESEATDTVYSYFALRDISYNENGLMVNGKPVFMRLVLDQGFNPDGIYTAPYAEFLKEDIELAIDLGFNGARLHQRVFEERTLYYADHLGYMLWAEEAAGIDLSKTEATEMFLPEWMEIFNMHYNHPSVIGWCPFNETYHNIVLHEATHTMLYRITKSLDPYRPVIDASGGVHYETDMFDVHDYEQDPKLLYEYLEPMLTDPNYFHSPIPRYRNNAPHRPEEYKGQPYWVSEYGGTFWNPNVVNDGKSAWGYGDAPKTEEEFASRYEGLTDVLLSHPRVCGFCYTQLTDIEQEQNGLYFYDRTRKFEDGVYDRIRAINMKRAAIEK